jgi:hypothetical protein
MNLACNTHYKSKLYIDNIILYIILSFMMFDCSICCSTQKKTKEVICARCDLHFCIKCQITYGKSDCMNCHIEFSKTFMNKRFGAKFFNTIIKPKLIKKLVDEQKEFLPLMKPIVDWELDNRNKKKTFRYGIKERLLECPLINTSFGKNVIFPCVVLDCNGFVTNNECATCHIAICMSCREAMTLPHVCDIDILKNIALINADTRPCPRCKTNIFRTDGCNHMFCTNCHTHFDWKSGHTLLNSTNGHYTNQARFNTKVAQVASDVTSSAISNECTPFSLYQDLVPLSNINKIYSHKLIRSIYEDSNTIRLIKFHKYNERIVLEKYLKKLQELQIKYLLNELTIDEWGKQIYNITNKKNIHLEYATIFVLYISSINMFQQQMLDGVTEDDICVELINLIELCNNNFNTIQVENGGSIIHIRSIVDDEDIAILSF